jgi:hypothetical protein
MSANKEPEEGSEDIKVSDHRRFNPDGTEKSSAGSEDLKKEEVSKSKPLEAEGAKAPEATFAGFILSLAGSAQISLGISPDPMTQKIEKDLSQAKHMIDLLGLLSEKTKGNLKPEESQLLEVILDLRLRLWKKNKSEKVIPPRP